MMRKLLFLTLVYLLAISPAAADTGLRYTPVPTSAPQLTVTSSAQHLTVPAGNPTGVLITVETANVRWRDDGTAPTASVGQLLQAGQNYFYPGTLTAIQFIAVSGSPVLDLSYYK